MLAILLLPPSSTRYLCPQNCSSPDGSVFWTLLCKLERCENPTGSAILEIPKTSLSGTKNHDMVTYTDQKPDTVHKYSMQLEAHNQLKSTLWFHIYSIPSVIESASATSPVCEHPTSYRDFFFPHKCMVLVIIHYLGDFICLANSNACKMQCWSVNGEFVWLSSM